LCRLPATPMLLQAQRNLLLQQHLLLVRDNGVRQWLQR
jgi:hypothetical protein